MRRVALALLLASQAAHARPGELRPPRDASRDLDGVAKIEKPGAGAVPDDADEVTYRQDLYSDRDRSQKTHVEQTRRMTDSNDRVRDTLMEMKPGEVRWSWYSEQDGSQCDCRGCARGPTPYAERLELVAVVKHHADLPDDIHITAWPYLGVRSGTTWASLPGDQIEKIEDVALAGGTVTIDVVETRFEAAVTRHERIVVTMDELRARLADSRGVEDMKQKKWKAAKAELDRAIALAPALDAPYWHRAAVAVALHLTPDLSVVAARNPVGLYWRVMTDSQLAGLRDAPAIRALVSKAPGTFDPVPLYRCRSCAGVAIDPGHRFVVAYASVVRDADFGLAFGALRVIDRSTGVIIDTIPLDGGGASDANDGTPRCAHCKQLVAAQRMLRDLGFTAAGAPGTPATPGPAIARTVRTKEAEVIAIDVFPDLSLQRWTLIGGMTDVVAARAL